MQLCEPQANLHTPKLLSLYFGQLNDMLVNGCSEIAYRSQLTLSEEWEVDFDNLPVKTKNSSEVGLNHISRQVVNNNHLRVGLFCGYAILHVDVGILDKARGG